MKAYNVSIPRELDLEIKEHFPDSSKPSLFNYYAKLGYDHIHKHNLTWDDVVNNDFSLKKGNVINTTLRSKDASTDNAVAKLARFWKVKPGAACRAILFCALIIKNNKKKLKEEPKEEPKEELKEKLKEEPSAILDLPPDKYQEIETKTNLDNVLNLVKDNGYPMIYVESINFYKERSRG